MNDTPKTYILWLALYGCALCTSCGSKPDRPPNIILFLVDDMGWQDTSVPFWDEVTPLNRKFHTPYMEQLASEGMKFTQAYACAVCSPTRISLMTGINAARHRVTNWTLRENASNDANHDVLDFPDWNVNGMSPVDTVERTVHATPLPALLKEAGYYTIHAGKAHFGAVGTPGADPRNLGFHVNIAGHAAGGPGSYLGTQHFSAAWRGGSRIWDVPGLEAYHGQDVFLTEALTIEANKAMDDAVQLGKPFFLYMSHYAVHVPFAPDQRFTRKYLSAGLDSTEAMYAAMVEGMDKSLGDLMHNVERHGLEDNTVILFMSDNGGLSAHARGNGPPHTHNKPLSSGKGSAHEGGIREPMLVKWPGTVQPGTACSDYLIIEDFFPTILEIAGVKTYNTVQHIDGLSFVPMLLQQSSTAEGRDLFWHYPNNWGPSGPGIGATSTVRSGDWKLIYYYADRGFELFNIREDIGEQHNLAGRHKDRVQELAVKLGNYLRSVDAQRPVTKVDGKAVPWPDVTAGPGALPSSNYHQLRRGCTQAFRKFRQTGKGTVAFLGGSITYNPGWRDSICQYLQMQFPHTEFTFIGAGIPSMGSTPGAFRLERDVLSKGSVDLLFVESAVNDRTNGRSIKEIRRGVEGIFRHAFSFNPEMDLVIMYFVDPEKMEDYNKGIVPEEIQTYELLATHYGVGSINLAREVTERIGCGEFSWEEDFVDLHPSPFGQGVYFRSMRIFLDAAMQKARMQQVAKTGLPEAIDPYNYSGGKLVDIRRAKAKKGWSIAESWHPSDSASTRKGFVDVPMLVGEQPGAALRFTFSGSAAGIVVAAGPDAGRIRYRMDKGPWQEQDLYTRWSARLHLPWYYVLGGTLDRTEQHLLEIEIVERKESEPGGHACRIVRFFVNE